VVTGLVSGFLDAKGGRTHSVVMNGSIQKGPFWNFFSWRKIFFSW